MKYRENNLIKELEAKENQFNKTIVSESSGYYEYIKNKGKWENILKRSANGIILRITMHKNILNISLI